MSRTTLALAAASLQTLALAAPGRAESDMYDLKTAETRVAPGAKGSTSVTIAAKGGWHVNMEPESPFKMTLSPDKGVEVTKAALGRADLAVKNEQAPRMDIAFTAPAEAGKKTINAELRFIMCQATACKPVKEKLALAVEVAAAPPATPTGPAGKDTKKSDAPPKK